MKEGECQISGCDNKAQYNLYKNMPKGVKRWIQVCDRCERAIGDANARRVGGKVEQK